MSDALTVTSPPASTVDVSIRAVVPPAVLFDTKTTPVEELVAPTIAVATDEIAFETVALMRLDETASTLAAPEASAKSRTCDRRIWAVAPAPGMAVRDDKIGSPINTSSA